VEIRNAILVAEDNEDDRLLLQRALTAARVLNPIYSVHDGEETIAYLEGTGPYGDREKFPRPILLLLDLNMPKKSGYEVLAWLQTHPADKLGVVVLTGGKELGALNRAYALGAHSFLVKPLVLQDFLNLVNAIKGIRIGNDREGLEVEFPNAA
jgi:CheY-like chemotaxis protein